MAETVFYGMRRLCYTNKADFTDFQGIGSEPIYNRYESVNSVLQNTIDEQYRSFLARPLYDKGEGRIYWYINEWNENPRIFKELSGGERLKYEKIKEDTIGHYKDVLSQLKKDSDDYKILSKATKYTSDDFIYCYDNKVSLIAWGMCPDSDRIVGDGGTIVYSLPQKEDRPTVTFELGGKGKWKMDFPGKFSRERGTKLTKNDIPGVVANEGYEFVGWSPADPKEYEVTEDVTFFAQYKEVSSPLSPEPPVDDNSGISEEPESEPEPEPSMVSVKFEAGQFGTIKGSEELLVPRGHILSNSEIPSVSPSVGYVFNGWDHDFSRPIDSDTIFEAQYETAALPWYKRFWAWLKRHNWLLWLLLALLVIILFVLLLKGCDNDDDEIKDPEVEEIEDPTPTEDNIDKVYPIDRITDPDDGTERDDNNPVGDKGDDNGGISDDGNNGDDGNAGGGGNGDNGDGDNGSVGGDKGDDGDNGNAGGDSGNAGGGDGGIFDDGGKLPGKDKPVVPPVYGGKDPAPIITDPTIPGNPKIIANRLNIFFDDENADLDKWCEEFKKLYPGDDYDVVGCDRNVPWLLIIIPEAERDKIREALPEQITSIAFFVVDETLISQGGKISPQANETKGWHLKAVHAEKAWKYTKGDPEIVVAIVDDGIDAEHPIFEGRFYNAYNVFRRDRRLGIGTGHGTHVAGLAVGNTNYLKKGAAGIAPNCRIMPVQVFDNDICTFSSLACGIMYALHNGANVVNVSIAPKLEGMDKLPFEEQQKIARQHFKNEEKVYRHIFEVAKERNVIIVFAAGNDNIMTAVLPECRTESTINVSAVNAEFKSTSFTNYSVGSTISAPGEAIYSSYPKSDFKLMDGTSMAAPIVTGAVALMLSIDSTLTVNEIVSIFRETGQRIDEKVPPMILIDKALERLINGPVEGVGNNPVPTPSDPSEPVLSDPSEPVPPDSDEIGAEPGQDDLLVELVALLERLRAQRDALDNEISEILEKIKHEQEKKR